MVDVALGVHPALVPDDGLVPGVHRPVDGDVFKKHHVRPNGHAAAVGHVQHAATRQVLELVARAAQLHTCVEHRVVPHAAGAVNGDELLHRHVFPQHHPGRGDIGQRADMAAFRNDRGRLRRAVVRQLRQTVMEPEIGQPGRVRKDHPLLALRHRRSILRAADDGTNAGVVQQLGGKAGVLQKGEHFLRALGIAEAQSGKVPVPQNLFSWEKIGKAHSASLIVVGPVRPTAVFPAADQRKLRGLVFVRPGILHGAAVRFPVGLQKRAVRQS